MIENVPMGFNFFAPNKLMFDSVSMKIFKLSHRFCTECVSNLNHFNINCILPDDLLVPNIRKNNSEKLVVIKVEPCLKKESIHLTFERQRRI